MISSFFSSIWTNLAPGLKDHLWQSTIFALAAALLTLALRNNHARTRYWLWLAASIKFLIPLSLLISAGSHLAKPRPSTISQPALYSAVEQASQPFTHEIVSGITSTPITHNTTHHLTWLLPFIWLIGFISVLSTWFVYWRRLSAAMQHSIAQPEGREAEMLLRIRQSAGLRTPITLLLSPSSLGPGIYGIIRPVLIWPKGISQRLEDEHLETIFAHEVCHVLRNDNLTAVIHMLVEAIFWFHPLVWWIGARMAEERERACDEAVLHLCQQPHTYAESILKVCEFYVESPLPCVSGVTGADLKKRIADILAERSTLSLNLSRKLLLATAALLVLAIPILSGQATAPMVLNPAFKPSIGFDVVSIKRNTSGSQGIRLFSPPDSDGITMNNIPLRMLIQFAYELPTDDLVSGLPDWTRTERYDISAKVAEADLATFRKYGPEQRNPMIPPMLEDRFKLKYHYAPKELPAYALVLAKGGSKMTEIHPAIRSNGTPDPGNLRTATIGEMQADGVPMVLFTRTLARILERPVIDRTGLVNSYTFTLKWTPDQVAAANAEPGTDGPSIFTAMQEQLGLKLEPVKTPVQVMVVDNIQRPTEN